jgi:hypothetical protein
LFTSNGQTLADGSRVFVGSQQWEIDYAATSGGLNFTDDYVSGSVVTITAVPEPATLALAAAASLGRAAPEGIRHDEVGRHLVAITGDVVIADLGDQAARAASGAVPTLDYREAIEVRVTLYALRSEEELAAVWPDAAPPGTRDLKTSPAGGAIA